jgi:hypothetical protein
MTQEIKPAYVTFEQAKWLKEKGFQELVNHYYFEDGEFKEHSLTGTNGYYGEEYEFNLSEFNENWNDEWLTKKSGDRCFGCSKDRGYFETYSAPEQHVVIEWLRVNHGLWVGIYYHNDNNKYQYIIDLLKLHSIKNWLFDGDTIDNGKQFNSPQEAYSAAFDYILNNLI